MEPKHVADLAEEGSRAAYLHSQVHLDSLARRIYDLRLRAMQVNPAERLKLKDEIAKLTAQEDELRR